MKYIESASSDPRFNLALEQYVFEHMDKSEEYFMLWQNHNTVVVGKNQNTFSEINKQITDENNVTVVRRLSGGGAVYHDMGNLNFTFILDCQEQESLDIKLFSRPVAEMLNALGVPAQVNGRNDITVDGKKFSGNSQYIRNKRIMHHGTIMISSDLDFVSKVLNVSQDKFVSKAAKSVKSRVTNLNQYLPKDIGVEEFKKLLVKYVLKDENIKPYVFSDEEIESIKKIQEERYNLWEWNYGFSPACEIKRTRRIEGVGGFEVYMNTEKGIIKNIKIYGDYFGLLPITELEKKLIGTELNESSLLERLSNVQIDSYFHGMKEREFIELLTVSM